MKVGMRSSYDLKDLCPPIRGNLINASDGVDHSLGHRRLVLSSPEELSTQQQTTSLVDMLLPPIERHQQY